MKNIPFVLAGVLFGVIMVKTEAISWFRIHEMFRFESFHMYGLIGVAIVVSALIIFVMKKTNMKTLTGHLISYSPMKLRPSRHLLAGAIYGMGWALSGTCPGPVYVLLGYGYWIVAIMFLGALLGTYSYALVKSKLPH